MPSEEESQERGGQWWHISDRTGDLEDGCLGGVVGTAAWWAAGGASREPGKREGGTDGARSRRGLRGPPRRGGRRVDHWPAAAHSHCLPAWPPHPPSPGRPRAGTEGAGARGMCSCKAKPIPTCF